MTDAMKAKEPIRLGVIRLIFNAIRKKEIDTRQDLTDAEVEKTMLTMLKQTQETLEQAQKAGVTATVDEAQNEIKIIREFLPQQMSEADVDVAVKAVVDALKAEGKLPQGGAAMGMAIKASMEKIGSRSEGKVVQAAVKKALGM